MDNCIFCKIAQKEIDAAIIWEDDSYMAFLDIHPNMQGMTLVIPKKHYDSNILDLDEATYTALLTASKNVSQLLKKGLAVHRVALVIEGLGVNHAHVKLYPLHGVDKEFTEIWANERIYFESYEGYISTQLGPQKEIAELQELAEEIKKA